MKEQSLAQNQFEAISSDSWNVNYKIIHVY